MALDIIRRCIRMEACLSCKHEWYRRERLPLATPVPWFGDDRQQTDSEACIKVATLGSNPSRREFVARDGDYYPPNARKLHHHPSEDLELGDRRHEAPETLHGLRRYFHHRPYYRWFGKPKCRGGEGGNMEAWVNGLGTSYYATGSRRAVHIHLLPFATRHPMGKLVIHSVLSNCA